MSFLDENCIIFDNDDENKLEYTTVHNVSDLRSMFSFSLSDEDEIILHCSNIQSRTNIEALKVG